MMKGTAALTSLQRWRAAAAMAAGLLAAPPLCPALPAGWGTDFEAAVEEAGEDGRPVLVFVGATWCPHCKRLEETTLKDAAVAEIADRFVKVALDYDEQPYLVAKFGLRGVPAALVLDPDGRRVATLGGFVGAEAFRGWLVRHAEEASPGLAASIAAANDAASEAMATMLREGSDAQLRELLEPMFAAALGHVDTAVAAVQARLATVAASRPSALVPLLLDDRLLVRIMAANALAAESVEEGSSPPDPWAPEPERRRAVDAFGSQ